MRHAAAGALLDEREVLIGEEGARALVETANADPYVRAVAADAMRAPAWRSTAWR